MHNITNGVYLKEEKKIKLDQKFIDLLKYEEMEEREEKKIIDLREDYTYGIQISVEDETKINELIKVCKELIDVAKGIVFE